MLASPRRAVLVLAAGSALVAAPSARAQAPVPAPPTVEAFGTATVKVVPKDSRSNASIAAAVRVAQPKALPKAIAEAREQAQELAAAAGVTLGALTSISNESTTPFFQPWGEDGTFGPGRYCGTVRTSRFKTVNGVRKRVGTRSVRRCRVPQVTRTVKLTFATTA